MTGGEDARGGRNGARVALASALGAVCLIWLGAMSRWAMTDTVVPWDSKNQFYAFFRFLANTLHAGASPFWNPYHYGGHPSVADPQSLIFAPVFLLWAWLDAAPSMRAFDLVVHAHLLAGAIGMVFIGRRAGWPATACVLSATLFMFGGAAAGRLQHAGLILSYSLFPPAWLLLRLSLERRSMAIGMAFTGTAALLALGRNQVALLLCYLLAAVALAEIAIQPRPLAYLRERLPMLLAMTAAGAALVSIPLLLTIQFASLSNRPDVALDIALKGSLHPANLATLAAPNIFGSHGFDYWGPGWRTPETALTDQSFNYLFVGAVPVVLLLWFGIARAGLTAGGAFERGRRLMTAVLCLCLLYMLGRYTPLFRLALDWVPGVRFFRRPVDADFVFMLALSFLSGCWMTDYLRDGVPRLSWWRPLAAAGLAVGVIASAILLSARAGHGGDALMEGGRTIALLVIAAACLAYGRTRRSRSVMSAAAVVVAVAELLWWNAASHLNAENRTLYAVLEDPAGEDARAIAILEREIRERHRQGAYPRVEIAGLGGAWQNLAMVRGWEATNGYNPLRIGGYDRLIAPGETNFTLDARTFPASFPSYDCALARALALDYIVVGRPLDWSGRQSPPPAFDTLLAGPHVWIYRLHRPAPRLNFVGRYLVADTDMRTTNGQLAFIPSPERVLIDDDTPPLHLVSRAPRDSRARARVVSLGPGRVEIDAESAGGGMLAWHATYYPGWTVEIDGRATPLLRADVLFLGVEVPAGRHRVVFRFAPLSVENLSRALRMALAGSR